jgi:hypothetical protein
MITTDPTPKSQYVVLRGIEHGNRFFSSYTQGDDATKMFDGVIAYEVLGYGETIYDCQEFLYNKRTADMLRDQRARQGRTYPGDERP